MARSLLTVSIAIEWNINCMSVDERALKAIRKCQKYCIFVFRERQRSGGSKFWLKCQFKNDVAKRIVRNASNIAYNQIVW